MKKILLTLLTMVTCLFVTQATEYTLTPTAVSGSSDPYSITYTSDPTGVTTFTLQAKKNSGTAPAYNTTNKDLRVYAGGAFTIKAPTGVNITGLVFNLSTQGKNRQPEMTPSVGTVTQVSQGTTITWSGSANEVTLTTGSKSTYASTTTNAGQFCFSSVKVTTDEGVSKAETYDPNFQSSYSFTLGEDDDMHELPITANGPEITYSISGDEGVLEIEDNVVYCYTAGSVTVKATWGDDVTWAKGEATFTVTVNEDDGLKDSELAFDFTGYNYENGIVTVYYEDKDSFVAPKLLNPNSIELTEDNFYWSTEPKEQDYITIAEDGSITINKVGSVEIFANLFDLEEVYREWKGGYTLNIVNKPKEPVKPVAGTSIFKKTTEIKEGNYYVIAYTNGKESKAFSNASSVGGVETLEVSDNKLLSTDATAIFYVTKNSDNKWFWQLYTTTGNGKYLGSSGSSTGLKWYDGTTDANAATVVGFDKDSNVTIQFGSLTTRNLNIATALGSFKNYVPGTATTSLPVQLYEFDPEATFTKTYTPALDATYSVEVTKEKTILDVTNAPEITWTVENPEIAKVENGVLTGLAMGSTNVTATWGDDVDWYKGEKTFSVEVTAFVYNPEFKGNYDETPNYFVVYKDETIDLAPKAQEGVTIEYTITSSTGLEDDNLISFEGNVVTGVVPGTVYVTASWGDDKVWVKGSADLVIDVLGRECAKPEITIAGELENGAYAEKATITMTNATLDSKMYYTLTKDEVAGEETEYIAPIVLTEVGDYTLTAYTTREGFESSATETVSFRIIQPDYIKIVFATSSSNDGTSYDSTKHKLSDIISEGVEFVESNSGDFYVAASKGLRIGTANTGKSYTLNLKDEYRIDKIVAVYSHYANNAESSDVSINGVKLTVPETVAESYKHTYTDPTITNKVTITTDGTKKRIIVASLKIYGEKIEKVAPTAVTFGEVAERVGAEDEVTVTLGTDECYPAAKIYYTTDGTMPTENSTLYTAPFALSKENDGHFAHESITLNVLAVNSEGSVHDARTVVFADHEDEVEDLVIFVEENRFNEDSSATIIPMKYDKTAGMYTATLTNVAGVFYVRDCKAGQKSKVMSFDASKHTFDVPEVETTQQRITTEDVNVTRPVYANDEQSLISLPASLWKSEGGYTATFWTTPMQLENGETAPVYFTTDKIDKANSVDTCSVELRYNPGDEQALLTFNGTILTTVESVAAEDGEAIYFNLQGLRVERPGKGLYIRVSGNKSEKVAL